MTQPVHNTSVHSTPRNKRDLALMNNYYHMQHEMSAAKRLKNTSFRSKVIKNKLRGQSNDKISAELRQPEVSDTASVYRKDYTIKQRAREVQERFTSQEILERHASANDRPTTMGRQNLNRSVGFIPGDLNDSGLQLNEEENHAAELNQTQPSIKPTTTGNEQVSEKKRLKMQYAEQWEPYFKLQRITNKIGMDYNGIRQSSYQRDFTELAAPTENVILKSDFYSTNVRHGSMEMKTTVKNDFKRWDQKTPLRAGPSRRIDFPAPFGGTSNYRTEFVDWRSNLNTYEKPIHHTTVVPDVKMVGTSAYRENFRGQSKDNEQEKEISRPVSQKPKEAIQTQKIPFLGETSYQRNYRVFKIGRSQESAKKEADIRPSTAYSGNYRTTSRTDYAHPKERIYWPGNNEEDDEYLSQSYLS